MTIQEDFPDDWEARVKLAKMIGLDPTKIKKDPNAIKRLDGCLSDLNTGGLDAVELVREIRDSLD